MRPRGARAEAPGGRADYEFYSRGAGDGRRLLIQRIRIEGRVAVPETAVGRTPGTRWFRAALEDTKVQVSQLNKRAAPCCSITSENLLPRLQQRLRDASRRNA